MISEWNPIRTRRSGDAYPDFQSAASTHQLKLVVVEWTAGDWCVQRQVAICRCRSVKISRPTNHQR
jgi:hypothetical protein